MPEDLTYLVGLAEAAFASELDGASHHGCFTRVIEGRQSRGMLHFANLACQAHALGDQSHDLSVHALDLGAQPRQRRRGVHAATTLARSLAAGRRRPAAVAK